MAAKRRRPSKDETAKRRLLVEKLWIEGHNVAEILRLVEKETKETWTRPTIYRDLDWIRGQWEKEGSKRSREGVRGELERMSRLVFSQAMSRKKTARRSEVIKDQDGNERVVTTTVLIPDPDFGAANRAVERMAALHGLNITTLDGQLGITGLSDVFGEVAEDVNGEAA